MVNLSAQMTKGVKRHRKFEVEHSYEESEKEERELSLDEIVSIKEENYYAAHQVPINIFKVATGNHMPFLTNEILDHHHFCKRQIR